MEAIKSTYKNFEFSCGIERNNGDESIVIDNIVVKRIHEVSKHPFGNRLAKIINKQRLNYKLPTIHIGDGLIYNSGYSGSSNGWHIDINQKSPSFPEPFHDEQKLL